MTDRFVKASRHGRSLSGADRIPPLWMALLHIFVIFASILLPTVSANAPFASILTWLVGVGCSVFLVVSLRRISEIVIALLVYMLTYSMFGSPTMPTLIFGFLFCTAAFSALVASAKKLYIIPTAITPVIIYALSFIITRDHVSAIGSLLWLPAAVGAGLMSKYKKGKTAVAVVFASITVLTVLITAGTYIFTVNKEISVDVIIRSVEYLRSTTVSYMREAIEVTGMIEITDAITKEIGAMVDAYINILPGFTVFSCIAIGYLINKLQVSLFDVFGIDELFLASTKPIGADVATALVFVIFFLMTFATNSSGNTSFVAIVSQNICLILTPVLFAVGWSTLKALPKRIGFFIILIWIAMITLVVLSGISILSVIALIGAFGVLIGAVDRWAKDHFAQNGNGEQ